jgi:hypothetical protein
MAKEPQRHVIEATDPLKTEDELKQIVLDKLHQLGFTWIVSVDLKHHAGQNPNWRIRRWSGKPPIGFDPTTIKKLPEIVKLRKKFRFKQTKPM